MLSTFKEDSDVGKLVQFVSYDVECPWHRDTEKEELVLGGVYLVKSEDTSLSENKPLQKILCVAGKVDDVILFSEQVHFLDAEKFI